MAEVVDASSKFPVLVDFWATWCGPCKTLTPTLEKVVRAQGGRVRLAKIDVDKNRELIAQLSRMGLPMQSVPTVVAFWQGQIADTFSGALPESEVKRFVEALLKLAGSAPPAVDYIAQGKTLLEAGEAEPAAQYFAAALQEDQDKPEAWGGFIRALMALGDEGQARQILAQVPPKLADHADIAGARSALGVGRRGPQGARRAWPGSSSVWPPNPDDFEARYELATALNASGARAEAAAALLDIIRRDRSLERWRGASAVTQILRGLGHGRPRHHGGAAQALGHAVQLEWAPPHPRLDELPEQFPVFPLGGALLLPGGHLPLNIFEPRYLAMVEDALGQGRYFGMIQPDKRLARGETGPGLYRIGCLGRITSFAETDDGRYLITLTGVIRFTIAEEIEMQRGYRRVSGGPRRVRGRSAPGDAMLPFPRQYLLDALRRYFATAGAEANWDAIADMADANLVTSLCMACPFSTEEKQALAGGP